MEQMVLALANFLNLAVTSPTGTAVAAVVLSFLVYLLTRIPFVNTFVSQNVYLKHGVMLFLAVAPAVVVTLTSKSSWYEAVVTAVVTFLAALGTQNVVPSQTV